jgi:hypothetical protein
MARAQQPREARRAQSSRTSVAATRKSVEAAGSRPARTAARRAGPRTTGQPRTPRRAPAGARTRSTDRARGGRGALPLVNVAVPTLRARIPDLGAIKAQTRWAGQAAWANLPSKERLLYYSALGLMAAAGVLEWPVAGVLAVGVWVAGRGGPSHRDRSVQT